MRMNYLEWQIFQTSAVSKLDLCVRCLNSLQVWEVSAQYFLGEIMAPAAIVWFL